MAFLNLKPPSDFQYPMVKISDHVSLSYTSYQIEVQESIFHDNKLLLQYSILVSLGLINFWGQIKN